MPRHVTRKGTALSRFAMQMAIPSTLAGTIACLGMLSSGAAGPTSPVGNADGRILVGVEGPRASTPSLLERLLGAERNDLRDALSAIATGFGAFGSSVPGSVSLESLRDSLPDAGELDRFRSEIARGRERLEAAVDSLDAEFRSAGHRLR